MTDEENTAYARARKRATDKLAFYNHFIVYVVVIAGLYVMNWVTLPEYFWAKWAALGWGIGVAIHGVAVYLGTDDPSLLDRMTERELQKDQQPRGD